MSAPDPTCPMLSRPSTVSPQGQGWPGIRSFRDRRFLRGWIHVEQARPATLPQRHRWGRTSVRHWKHCDDEPYHSCALGKSSKLNLPIAASSFRIPAVKKFRRFKPLFIIPTLGLFCLAGLAQISAAPVADFSLVDVNATSPRFDTEVSPRDYLHQVSGYYFGDAN